MDKLKYMEKYKVFVSEDDRTLILTNSEKSHAIVITLDEVLQNALDNDRHKNIAKCFSVPRYYPILKEYVSTYSPD